MLPLRGCPRNVGERHLELKRENHFRATCLKGNEYGMSSPALMDELSVPPFMVGKQGGTAEPL